MPTKEQIRDLGLSDLRTGGIYRIRSRNLIIGVFDGTGFIGIREKFGSRYLFTEYPMTVGGLYMPFETVAKAEYIGTITEGIPLTETLGLFCSNCGMKAWWLGPPAPADWACEGNCEKTLGCHQGNKELFDVLQKAEELEGELDGS